MATQRLEQLGDADLTEANVQTAARLGVPFKVVDIKPSRFRVEVAKRIAAFNEQAGLPCPRGGRDDREAFSTGVADDRWL